VTRSPTPISFSVHPARAVATMLTSKKPGVRNTASAAAPTRSSSDRPPKILVTPRSVTRHSHPSLDLLRSQGWEVVICQPGAQPNEDELRTLLPGCIGYLAGVEPVTARALETATSLRAISRNGTGIDNIDLAATTRLGITVLRAEGANARGVAELTIAHLLSLARHLPTAQTSLRAGRWGRPPLGNELEGKTLGLAGCGRVGQLVAKLALALTLTASTTAAVTPASETKTPLTANPAETIDGVAANTGALYVRPATRFLPCTKTGPNRCNDCDNCNENARSEEADPLWLTFDHPVITEHLIINTAAGDCCRLSPHRKPGLFAMPAPPTLLALLMTGAIAITSRRRPARRP